MTYVSQENPHLSILSQKIVKLGEETTKESYNRMPIENFGKNILSKYGWNEDQKTIQNGKE